MAFSAANKAFRNGEFSRAAEGYWCLAKRYPVLLKHVAPSFHWLRAAWLKQRRVARAAGMPPRMAVIGWDLSHNAAGRALTLMEAWRPVAPDIELVGCIFKQYGNELWAPMRSASIECHYFICEKTADFIEDALKLVLAHPYELIHVSKPRMPALIFAWLYQLVWGAQVILDVDDEELAFIGVGDAGALTFKEVERELRSIGLKGLRNGMWTQVAVGKIGSFPLRTVSNPALQKRYGGQLLPHVRPSERFKPSIELRQQARKRWGIPEAAKVVLFAGTPRRHKGLLDLASALADMKRSDVWLVVAGEFPRGLEDLKDQLLAMENLKCLLIPGQPYERNHEVVAVGDLTVLLQDSDSRVSEFQLPAKLIDALGMGLAVVATATPAIAHLVDEGVVVPVTGENLAETLSDYLDRDLSAQAERGRTYFLNALTVEAIERSLVSLMDQAFAGRGAQMRWEDNLPALSNGSAEWLFRRLRDVEMQPG